MNSWSQMSNLKSQIACSAAKYRSRNCPFRAGRFSQTPPQGGALRLLRNPLPWADLLRPFRPNLKQNHDIALGKQTQSGPRLPKPMCHWLAVFGQPVPAREGHQRMDFSDTPNDLPRGVLRRSIPLDRGRDDPLVWDAPPSEPDVQISRIRLSG